MGLLQGYKQFTELLGRFKSEPQRIAWRAQRLMRNYRIDRLLVPKPSVPVTTRRPLWSGSPRSKTDIFRNCLPAEPAETAEWQPLPPSCCWWSVVKSCLTLCDPMDCSPQGSSVLHSCPEFVQTHVYWVSDAIQSSHPLLPSSSFALHLS